MEDNQQQHLHTDTRPSQLVSSQVMVCPNSQDMAIQLPRTQPLKADTSSLSTELLEDMRLLLLVTQLLVPQVEHRA
jgi:hypothetical protein